MSKGMDKKKNTKGKPKKSIKDKKASKDSKRKQYWQGRIDALAGKPAYKNWLKRISKKL